MSSADADQRVRGYPGRSSWPCARSWSERPSSSRVSGARWPPLFALAIVGMLVLVMLGQNSEPEIVATFAATVALAEWVAAIGPATDGSDTFTHAQLSAASCPSP